MRAEKLVLRIENAMNRLARNPMTGTSCSEHGTNMRFWSVKPYVIYYKPTDFGIEVVRVLHGSQDADAELT